jgi:hypothetical protein
MLKTAVFMCGMNFQDVSSMYHCRDCDTLTDFEEPVFDSEDDYLAWKGDPWVA